MLTRCQYKACTAIPAPSKPPTIAFTYWITIPFVVSAQNLVSGSCTAILAREGFEIGYFECCLSLKLRGYFDFLLFYFCCGKVGIRSPFDLRFLEVKENKGKGEMGSICLIYLIRGEFEVRTWV